MTTLVPHLVLSSLLLPSLLSLPFPLSLSLLPLFSPLLPSPLPISLTSLPFLPFSPSFLSLLLSYFLIKHRLPPGTAVSNPSCKGSHGNCGCPERRERHSALHLLHCSVVVLPDNKTRMRFPSAWPPLRAIPIALLQTSRGLRSTYGLRSIFGRTSDQFSRFGGRSPRSLPRTGSTCGRRASSCALARGGGRGPRRLRSQRGRSRCSSCPPMPVTPGCQSEA